MNKEILEELFKVMESYDNMDLATDLYEEAEKRRTREAYTESLETITEEIKKAIESHEYTLVAALIGGLYEDQFPQKAIGRTVKEYCKMMFGFSEQKTETLGYAGILLVYSDVLAKAAMNIE